MERAGEKGTANGRSALAGHAEKEGKETARTAGRCDLFSTPVTVSLADFPACYF